MATDLTYDVARSELLDFVPSHAKTLLDIGCGAGRYAEELAARRPEVQLWGVEPDRDHADRAEAHFARLIVGTFEDAAADLPLAHFDVVTFNDVLEHMIDPAAALSATAPLLKPGGVVVASIPNVRHRSVLWPLLRRADWTYEEFGLLDRTHLRFFTSRTMRSLFEEHGWHVDSVVGINRCWDWRDDGRERRRLRLLRRCVGRRLDDFFYVQYVVTARPHCA